METTNWKLCFICQTATDENVTDPAASVKLHGQPDKRVACYQELLNNISELHRLGELPSLVSVASSYIGGGGDNKGGGASAVQVMLAKHASWHKDCRSLVNKQKVERAQRKSERDQSQSRSRGSPMKMRRMSSEAQFISDNSQMSSSGSSVSNEEKCFFCEELGDRKDLRKASTLGLNQKVYDTARKLCDVNCRRVTNCNKCCVSLGMPE